MAEIEASIEVEAPTVEVYPNPTSDFVNVLVTAKEESSIDMVLYNSIGQAIYQENSIHKLESTIDLSAYSKGIYIAVIQIGADQFTKRIVLK